MSLLSERGYSFHAMHAIEWQARRLWQVDRRAVEQQARRSWQVGRRAGEQQARKAEM